MKRHINNILVTGGAGFIGSAFIRYLLAQKDFSGTIVNLDLLTYAGDLKNLSTIENDPRYIFNRGNICDGKLVEKICNDHQIDTIVHFAAETHVDRSIEGPFPFIETNVYGTFTLLEIVKKRPHIHFHHISTDEVYGSLGLEGCFDETSPYKPNSPYSAAKAASDHFVRAYFKTYDISMTLSHCSNNYGPCQHMEKLIPTIIFCLMEKKSIPVYGNGKNVRDWLFVDDHADAIWQILKFGEKGQTYDIGGGVELSNIDLIKLIIKKYAETAQKSEDEFLPLISFVADRLGHDFRYAIDNSKIQKELKWSPKFTLLEGIKQTIDWYVNNNLFCLQEKI